MPTLASDPIPQQQTKNIRLRQLRDWIREATYPDDPQLITEWLRQEPCDSRSPLDHQWQHYEDQFNLLMDTISDELLPAHWRCSCLDQIHQPLRSLSRLSSEPHARDRVRLLLWELSVTTQFVRASL